ncbi:TRAP transporter substrate-binding protein [Larsenimonas rhizosphaerae]|uniref:TRAP transporter substrate-binding protein n=1 Tax=Larsenimonas rhizosphaerae TaxID=2944682 RepID=UPI0020343690|nr:TRAP transporter substrate-binding protein [Larsenimonas rhizosphaerae]MCM2131296.1 TRAP transporter substrate-binding protein [Larsenimonas rhizosphaerae]
MGMLTRTLLGTCLSLGALLAVFSSSAQAATTLRIAHFLPSVSNIQKNVLEPWCAELQTRSEDELRCQIYPSMQLGGTPAQLADMARNGVVDIAWTALGYSAGRFPRSETLELPFMLPAGGVTANRIIWEFTQRYAQDDFKEYKVLAVHTDGGTAFHTRNTPIRGAGDMKGLRMRASTRMASQVIDALGGAPVSMPPAQIADTLSKGVIDGAALSWEVVLPAKLDEVTRFHSDTRADQTSPTITVLALLMNKRRYDRLPDEQKQVLDALSGAALSQRAGVAWDKAIAEARQTVASDPTQTLVTLDDAAHDAMRQATQPIVDRWANSTEGGIDRPALITGLQGIVAEQAPELK